MTTDPIIITADEVAAILRLSPRSLEKRHTWSPKFPAPLTRRHGLAPPSSHGLTAATEWRRHGQRDQPTQMRNK